MTSHNWERRNIKVTDVHYYFVHNMVEYRCNRCSAIFEIDMFENDFFIEKKYKEDCDLEMIKNIHDS